MPHWVVSVCTGIRQLWTENCLLSAQFRENPFSCGLLRRGSTVDSQQIVAKSMPIWEQPYLTINNI